MGKIAVGLILGLVFVMPLSAFAANGAYSISYFHGIHFNHVGDTITIVNTDTKSHTVGGHDPSGYNFVSPEILPHGNYTFALNQLGDYYLFDYADSSNNGTFTVYPDGAQTPFVERSNNGQNQTIQFNYSNATLVFDYSNATHIVNYQNLTTTTITPTATTTTPVPVENTTTTTNTPNPAPVQQAAPVQTETAPSTTATNPPLGISISVNTLAKCDAFRQSIGLPPLESVYSITFAP